MYYNFIMDEIDRVILKITLFQEASICSDKEKIMIANVIFNRTEQKYFSNGTVSDTCLKPYQFSGWNPNTANMNWIKNIILSLRQFYDAKYDSIINQALQKDITDGSLLYYSPESMNPPYSIPDWNWNELILTYKTEYFNFYKLK